MKFYGKPVNKAEVVKPQVRWQQVNYGQIIGHWKSAAFIVEFIFGHVDWARFRIYDVSFLQVIICTITTLPGTCTFKGCIENSP